MVTMMLETCFGAERISLNNQP